jgi:amino acid adenylation domain-containing protein
MSLHELIVSACAEHGARTALVEGAGTGSVDYAALGRLSDRVRDRLAASGLRKGDRVGIYLRKSVESVASILGILKAGCAYVPVDPTAPASRNAYVHVDAGVALVIVERRFERAYVDEVSALRSAVPPLVVVESVGGGAHLAEALDRLDAVSAAPASVDMAAEPDDLAYILYTSGSTGRPKGVMLSHRNATSFVGWCARVFRPRPEDVFSSHAPFHFDLSILDIFLALSSGARLVLIPEETGKDPLALSRVIEEHGITCWYSVPSVLRLLSQFGRIGEHDYSSLRLVLFAGEVFPIAHLRAFKAQVPAARYFNLYGPTETNVCTYFEIPRVIPEDQLEPFPIGAVCENLVARVVDAQGVRLPPGSEGELCIAGDNVMQGYWNLPEQTAGGFLPPDRGAQRWYKTGDIVAQDENGDYRYLGRRDRMVKKRGHRVELGEIENCLHRHDAVREASVVALSDQEAGIKIKAHLSTRDGIRPSLVALKIFCSRHLPLYMVPDEFAFHNELPRSSTGKVDLHRLNQAR